VSDKMELPRVDCATQLYGNDLYCVEWTLNPTILIPVAESLLFLLFTLVNIYYFKIFKECFSHPHVVKGKESLAGLTFLLH